MSSILSELRHEASGAGFVIFASALADLPWYPRSLDYFGTIGSDSASVAEAALRSLEAEPEDEFEQQKRAFLEIPPLYLAQYTGQYVVSRDGVIVDHDPDLPTLTRRFFSQFSQEIPAVYIARVGGETEVRIVTPFFE